MRTIAVVGTGFIGSVHARNAARHPGARLAAVYDANFESAKRIAGATGAQAVADVAEIFDNREIEAVVIATPTNTHVEYLRRAAQASKAIYCEKPIGLDYQEAEQAIDSSRRTAYGYDERIEVFGSKGMIESRRQRARGVSRYFGDKVIEDGLHAGWFERIEQSYYQALDVFLGAIAQGTLPSPSLEDGLKAQLLADKATESLKTGRPVKFTK
jgi:predicted dehydrogenase